MTHRSLTQTASLDDRISEARDRLQRTPEWHPEFERRLLDLIRLVDERDACPATGRTFAAGWDYPGA
jgi:hypothetical protein